MIDTKTSLTRMAPPFETLGAPATGCEAWDRNAAGINNESFWEVL